MKGKIIFLNGGSSTGKTTLARTLQLRLPEHFYWLDYDNFIQMAVEKPGQITDPHKFFQKGKDPVTILFQTIKLFSDLGVNVISEGWFFRPFPKEIKAYETCVKMLHMYPILSVLVTCPIEELHRREIERGNRRIGAAADGLLNIDTNIIYDIVVDTFNNSKEECADKIIELLNNTENFTAFKKLWLQYNKN